MGRSGDGLSVGFVKYSSIALRLEMFGNARRRWPSSFSLDSWISMMMDRDFVRAYSRVMVIFRG